MTVHAYRIVKAGRVDQALSGEGARRFGGRWNSPGAAVVYAASSRSLAMLEMLVHLGARELLGRYAVIPLTFDASIMQLVDVARLPRDWRDSPPAPTVQRIGDDWIRRRRSAVLRVPSVLVPEEPNFLLNPTHPDFAEVHARAAESFRFDHRLASGG